MLRIIIEGTAPEIRSLIDPALPVICQQEDPEPESIEKATIINPEPVPKETTKKNKNGGVPA